MIRKRSNNTTNNSLVACRISHIACRKQLFVLIITLVLSLQSLSAQDSQDPYWVYLDKGMSFYQERSLDSAIYYYNKAIEMDPEASDGYFRRALVKEKLDQFDDANEDYLKAIELNPQPVYYSNLGLNKSIKGYNEEAIEYFNEAIKLDSSYMQAFMNRAIAYHYMGNMENACDDANKAYELGFGLAKQYLEENCTVKAVGSGK